jgi:hypothetical protein
MVTLKKLLQGSTSVIDCFTVLLFSLDFTDTTEKKISWVQIMAKDVSIIVSII